jgi:hypothetical protein
MSEAPTMQPFTLYLTETTLRRLQRAYRGTPMDVGEFIHTAIHVALDKAEIAHRFGRNIGDAIWEEKDPK